LEIIPATGEREGDSSYRMTVIYISISYVAEQRGVWFWFFGGWLFGYFLVVFFFFFKKLTYYQRKCVTQEMFYVRKLQIIATVLTGL